MKDLNILAIIGMFLGLLIGSLSSSHKHETTIKRLERDIVNNNILFEEYRYQDCYWAIERSCYYSVCSEVSIEEMQEKICDKFKSASDGG